MIVLDASAALEMLLQTRAAGPISDRVFDPRETVHAPELLQVEVVQVLSRYWLGGELDDLRGRQALADLRDLPVELYPHHPLLTRVWDLRGNVTAYDAAYLALAEALDAPVVTCDARLARSAPPGIEIQLFSSSG